MSGDSRKQVQAVADEPKEAQAKEKPESGEGAASSSSAARKKEPPAVAWKLTGYADGLTLTAPELPILPLTDLVWYAAARAGAGGGA